MRWFNDDELRELGIVFGKRPRISRRCSIWRNGPIILGDHVRIDDFCVLSAGAGGLFIGSYVHLAVYSSLMGHGKISLGEFSNISSRVSVYSSSDDFSGEWMTNPTLPESYTNVLHAPVSIGRHVIVGSGSILLPGADLGDGVAVGAMSLVKGRLDDFGIYAGVPARRLRSRSRRLLDLERSFRGSQIEP